MLVRKEIHTRQRFARKMAEYYFKRMVGVEKGGGNILTCAASNKYCQAKRIFMHYQKEFGLIMFPEIYKK